MRMGNGIVVEIEANVTSFVRVLPEVYFAPTRGTAVTSATARRLAADAPARLRAKPAGSPCRTTATTSATPGTAPASVPGGRVIPVTGARCSDGQLRYKMSKRYNPLILPAKQTISCVYRYKIS